MMDGSFDEHRDRVELNYEVFEYYVPETYTGYYDRQKDKIIFTIDISRKALVEGKPFATLSESRLFPRLPYRLFDPVCPELSNSGHYCDYFLR